MILRISLIWKQRDSLPKFKTCLKCRIHELGDHFRPLETGTSLQNSTLMPGKEQLFWGYKWLEIKHDGESSLLHVKYSGLPDGPV